MAMNIFCSVFCFYDFSSVSAWWLLFQLFLLLYGFCPISAAMCFKSTKGVGGRGGGILKNDQFTALFL